MNRDADILVVIQCAASMNDNAGHFMSDDGRKILFVADPDHAPASDSTVYRRPDDFTSPGRTYRDELVAYNRNHRTDNPLGLLPAWKLYRNEAYRRLVETFGIDKVFILSAGWGLIAADFLTPNYGITFSNSARKENAYERRSKHDPRYHNFCMIPEKTSSHVVFLGGKDYVSLFCEMTAKITRRTVFHNADTPPNAPGCTLRRYEIRKRTNWHYECAQALISGTLAL